MDEKVRLLDCSLRDGGHLNQGYFGSEVISDVIIKLIKSNIDIIEVGFLWDKKYDTNVARYYSIKDVKRILPKERGNSKFALMADFIDLENLEENDGTIEYIRLSFKRHRLDWALNTGRILKDKGYQVFINPVNCNVYTDEQYLDVIRQVNELKPYAFSIVDTFGVMRLRELSYRYALVENNLDKNICIGLHLHENLGLAYSLAQEFLKIASPTRRIVIDGSLMGIGRVPGNLCIEQIMDHINHEYDKKYVLEPVYDAIDDYIVPIRNKITWGYAIPYALSAKYNLHRSYAEYLLGKWKLRTSDIEKILASVDVEHSEFFEEEYIESKYRDYLSVPCESSKVLEEMRGRTKNRIILLVAPGESINKNEGKIIKFIKMNNPIVICIHCVPQFLKADYIFLTNIKRYEVLRKLITDEVIVATSNLMRYNECKQIDYFISFEDFVYHNGEYCEDSTLVLLNILRAISIHNVVVAGFDGLTNGQGKFYIQELSRNDRDIEYSNIIRNMLYRHYGTMNIKFITNSLYCKKEDNDE